MPLDGQRCALPTNIRSAQVDSIVWRWLCALVVDPEAVLKGYQKIQQMQSKKHADVNDEISRARKRITKYNETLLNFAEMLNDGLITKEIMRQKKEELDAQCLSAQAVLDEYEAKLATRRVLTDSEIAERVTIMRQIKEEVGDLYSMEFSERRNSIALLDITAHLGLDKGRIYVDIYWCDEFQEKFWLDSQSSSALPPGR
jgi:hypothetical protein